MIEAIEDDITVNYDEKPIIIICDERTKKSVLEILERKKF